MRIVMSGRFLVLISICVILGCTESAIPLPAAVVADASRLQGYVGKKVEIVGTFGHYKIGPHLEIGDRAVALTAPDERSDPKWPNDTFPRHGTPLRVVGTLEDGPCLRDAQVYLISAGQGDRDG
jgi:hypothetical protein